MTKASFGSFSKHTIVFDWRFCCLGLAALVLSPNVSSGQGDTDSKDTLQRFELSIPSMGSHLDMVVYAMNESHAQTIIQAGLDEVERLTTVLSNYDSNSEISQVVQAKPNTEIQLSEDLKNTLLESRRWYRLSQGKFDITYGPVIKLWKESRKLRVLPKQSQLDLAKGSSGWENVSIVVDRSMIELRKPNMNLDVSGIAVGYIIDRAFEKMQSEGATSILINAGGDIRVGDPPPGKTGWRIEIAGLGLGAPRLSVLQLANCAVTTSGDLFQYVEIDGHRYSHFVDPEDLKAIERRQSVTVIANATVDADAGATALAILGPERTLPIFEQLPIREAIFIDGTSDLLPARLRYFKK